MGYLTERREGLSAALAGGDLTEAGAVSDVKALPALVVEAADPFLDGRIIPAGPGRSAALQLRATVYVRSTESDNGQRAIEEVLEAILARIPRPWRFDRTDAPYPVRVGELTARAAASFFSTPSNVSSP